jgi:calnexin
MLSPRKSLFLALCIGLTFIVVTNDKVAHCQGADDPGSLIDSELESEPPITTTTDKDQVEPVSGAKDKSYTSPKIKPDGVFLYENFDHEQQFKTKWINSKDPKYTGEWQLNSGPDRPHADLQLLLPLRARHYAISSKLSEAFKFSDDKPLVVQYEVQFREGLDCGGAYVKLLRNAAIDDLTKLTDTTPYSIMFGPDKCGSEAKLHFIIQYYNPKTHEYGEKHWKQAKYVSNLLAAFSDKKYHLFKLVLEPRNNFEIFLDDKSVGKGNLLEDFDPPINPPKEIVDPSDTKPDDWDERPQIEDPDATKPDDWDENAPRTIEDPNAKKPDDWLDNEPKYIPDPNAKKPEDWEDMDGEWEAPLIDNPACAQVSGCGEWKPPMVANPSYKGKWKPPKIDNPKYKGKWAPRSIPNPDYFFDEKPFSSLDPIGAIAFELWSMADNIAFDNMIITNNPETANLVQLLSWQEKKAEADATSPSQLTRAMHYLKMHPWLWALIVIAIALPLFLFISYCCDTKKSTTDGSAKRKKTDESKPDEHEKKDDDDDEDAADEVVESEEPEEEEEEDKAAGDKTSPSKRPVRQRKKN